MKDFEGYDSRSAYMFQIRGLEPEETRAIQVKKGDKQMHMAGAQSSLSTATCTKLQDSIDQHVMYMHHIPGMPYNRWRRAVRH